MYFVSYSVFTRLRGVECWQVLSAGCTRPGVRAVESGSPRLRGAVLPDRQPAQAHLHSEPRLPRTGTRSGEQPPPLLHRPSPPRPGRLGTQRLRQDRHRPCPHARLSHGLRGRLQVCEDVRLASVPAGAAADWTDPQLRQGVAGVGLALWVQCLWLVNVSSYVSRNIGVSEYTNLIQLGQLKNNNKLHAERRLKQKNNKKHYILLSWKMARLLLLVDIFQLS